MDILHLVDRLEELFNESRSVPFTHSVIVDEDRMLDIIDQMRVSIPEEIKKAQQLLAQRDRILAQAQEEANRTIALAREKGDSLTERDAIVQAAQARGEQIIAQARVEVEVTKRDGDQYVMETLTNLEMEMERILGQVRNGIRSLQTEKTPENPPEEQPQPEPKTFKKNSMPRHRIFFNRLACLAGSAKNYKNVILWRTWICSPAPGAAPLPAPRPCALPE